MLVFVLEKFQSIQHLFRKPTLNTSNQVQICRKINPPDGKSTNEIKHRTRQAKAAFVKKKINSKENRQNNKKIFVKTFIWSARQKCILSTSLARHGL